MNPSASTLDQEKELQTEGKRYSYQPKPDEFHNNDILLSAGNIYHEAANPALAKFVSQV